MSNMSHSPKEASEKYNIHPKTLSRLADKGIIEYILMPGSNHRRHNISSIEKHLKLPTQGKTVQNARVSTQSQKDDLLYQLIYLQEHYCGNECISEIGSGLNFKRQKFLNLIERVLLKDVSLIVVAYPDRFVRFGFDFFEWLCKLHDCSIYWLKSKVFEYVAHIARTKFNILTSRVAPWGTSKYSAIDGSLTMRTSDNQVAELISYNPRSWLSFSNTEGYHPGTIAVAMSGYMIHSGLNAARNIGIKFYQRYKTHSS